VRHLPGVLGFAALHFVLSYSLAFSADVAATVLTFPLSVIDAPDTSLEPVFWLAWVLLGLGWGAALLFLGRRLLDQGR
jgi:hypothetical protein